MPEPEKSAGRDQPGADESPHHTLAARYHSTSDDDSATYDSGTHYSTPDHSASYDSSTDHATPDHTATHRGPCGTLAPQGGSRHRSRSDVPLG